MPLTRLPLGTAVSGNLPAANYKAGSVIQTVQSVLTNTYSANTDGYADIGLSASITPTSSSNKILVYMMIQGGAWVGEAGVRLLRGTTAIGIGVGGSHQATSNLWAGFSDSALRYSVYNYCVPYLDSPASTDQQTYKVQADPGGSQNLYINRSWNDNESNRVPSTLTLMEIAG